MQQKDPSPRPRARPPRGGSRHGPTREWLDPAFNRFLHAALDDGKPDQFLTVVSALARLDLDPWHEAAVLARLSSAGATERLTVLFRKIPAFADAPLDAQRRAARLVELLPRHEDMPKPVPPESDEPVVAQDESAPQEWEQDPSTRRWLKVTIIMVLVIIALSTFARSPLSRLIGANSPSPAAAPASSLGVDPR